MTLFFLLKLKKDLNGANKFLKATISNLQKKLDRELVDCWMDFYCYTHAESSYPMRQ
jgi:hypothetical protein